MAGALSPWRALRPVLLAGAATLTWLTLSASAASADALPDTTSLLGGATSSVAAVTGSVIEAIPATPSTPAPTDMPVGLLQPVTDSVVHPVDAAVASVPVVNQVVPAGTIAAVSTPVAEVVDAVIADTVSTVVPPVAEALPVLEPILQPVSDLVIDTASLIVPLPQVSGPDVTLAISDVDVQEASEVAANGTTSADILLPTALPATDATVLSDSPGAGQQVSTAFSGAGSALPSFTYQTGVADPLTLPMHAPGVPASGTGTSVSTGGAAGSVAWLDPFDLDLLLPGADCAGEIPEHAPSPVSFDPGSSPD